MLKRIFGYIEPTFTTRKIIVMEQNHKRALVAIFGVLFTCLVLGTIFVSTHTQSFGISSILIVVAVILAVDIGWVLKSETAKPNEQ